MVDGMTSGDEESGDEKKKTIFRDIRRYYCDICGICRSKKSLIRSHMLSHHKDETKDAQSIEANADVSEKGPYTCQECGVTFRKPAYLKQHMQSHSLERLFACPLDDCHYSYRRKDHLTRHLLKHQGKLFTCPVENCNRRFAFQGNMKRHVKEFHDEDSPCAGEKQHICQEVGCGKTFKYASKLRKHEDSHVKLDCVEVYCCEPGCMKPFSSNKCLKDHMRSCHQYVCCEVCGTQQLKKNFKQHQRSHEDSGVTDRIKCSFKGCQYTFSKKSNLNKHVKAVHEDLRLFTCRVSGCGQKFPYKHVRDNHEKSGAHVYIQGDFVEADELRLSRSRGGRKRKGVSIEALTAMPSKRIASPNHAPTLEDGTEYLRWLLSDDQI